MKGSTVNSNSRFQVRLRCLLWASGLVFCTWCPAFGQWPSCTVISGANVIDVEQVGGTTIALTTANVCYVSTRYGDRWSQLHLGVENRVRMQTIYTPVDDGGASHLYIGTDVGIYHYEVNGDSCRLIDSTLTKKSIISIVSVTCDRFGRTMFAGCAISGMYRTSDDGASWQIVDVATVSLYLNRLAAFKDDSGGSTLYIGSGVYGAYRSTDNGDTWKRCNGITSNVIESFADVRLSNGGIRHLIGTAGYGIYCSDDGGVTWTPKNGGLGDLYVHCIAAVPDARNPVLLAGTQTGIARSTNGGDSWVVTCKRVGVSNVFDIDVAIKVNGDLHVFAATARGVGILRSDDGGATWDVTTLGMNELYFRPLCVSRSGDANPSVFIQAFGVGLYRSDDDGDHWTQISIVDTSFEISSMLTYTTNSGAEALLCCTSAGIYRSMTNGDSWQRVSSVSTANCCVAVSNGQGGSDLYVGTYTIAIYRSVDFGSTWKLVSAPLQNGGTTNRNVDGLAAIRMDDGTTILWACYNGVVVRTTDVGRSWAVPTGLAVSGLSNVYAVRDTNGGWILLAPTSVPGFAKSSDLGVSWTYVQPKSFPSTMTSLQERLTTNGAATLVSGSRSGYAYYSVDGGRTWSSSFVHERAMNDLSIISVPHHGRPSMLIAGSRGVWRLADPTDSGASSAPDVDSNTMSQPVTCRMQYPEPTSQYTTFVLTLHKASELTLQVYTIQGDMISSTVDYAVSTGDYWHVVDVQKWPTGVYVFSAKAGSSQVSRLIHVMR